MALTYPRLHGLPGAGQEFDSRSPASQGNVLVMGQPRRTALTKLCKVRTLHTQEHPNAKAFAQVGPQETRQPAACPGMFQKAQQASALVSTDQLTRKTQSQDLPLYSLSRD